MNPTTPPQDSVDALAGRPGLDVDLEHRAAATVPRRLRRRGGVTARLASAGGALDEEAVSGRRSVTGSPHRATPAPGDSSVPAARRRFVHPGALPRVAYRFLVITVQIVWCRFRPLPRRPVGARGAASSLRGDDRAALGTLGVATRAVRRLVFDEETPLEDRRVAVRALAQRGSWRVHGRITSSRAGPIRFHGQSVGSRPHRPHGR